MFYIFSDFLKLQTYISICVRSLQFIYLTGKVTSLKALRVLGEAWAHCRTCRVPASVTALQAASVFGALQGTVKQDSYPYHFVAWVLEGRTSFLPARLPAWSRATLDLPRELSGFLFSFENSFPKHSALSVSFSFSQQAPLLEAFPPLGFGCLMRGREFPAAFAFCVFFIGIMGLRMTLTAKKR